MSTVIEDPEIPLVGRTKYPKYSGPQHGKLKRTSSVFQNVGCRLAWRKELFRRRRKYCDLSVIFAFAGIALMILEAELCSAEVFGHEDVSSILIRSMVTMFTIALLAVICLYHKYNAEIFRVDNGMEDWKIGITKKKIASISLELIICAIHPFPQHVFFYWPNPSGEWIRATGMNVPLDVVLSLPMFLRLYLISRTIMLHSKLYADVSSQSLGALNRVHFNFGFIFRSIMALHADWVLVSIMIIVFLVGSWSLRTCEQYVDSIHGNFFNAMWLISITFLSVGYGDIIPHSYCGRVICVMTGIMGAGCTALVVAVLARKLNLSQSEKYVHDFVLDIDLGKKRKHAAANIVKAGWLIYKYKRCGDNTYGTDIRKHQRKLLESIHSMRELRGSQRRLMDGTVTLVEMNKGQTRLTYDVNQIRKRQDQLDKKVTNIELILNGITSKLDDVHNFLKKAK